LRFGPLLPEGGRRRLNVAVTRARQKLTVVSRFSYLDIDLSRVRPGSGVELLRNYLQYAASNGKRLGDADLTSEPLNAFEAEVFDCLSSAGLKLIPQTGASQFRIDMVAQHPTKPGRYVLAIEFDGATYHSSDTARDRDRLRQQQLVNLGWRFHRIWSTEWFQRKEDEIRRTMKAFEQAVLFADKQDRGAAVPNNHGNGNHREIGVGVHSGTITDPDRYAGTHNEADRGKFKTPSLRNIGLTAPYMYDGSLKDLKQVMDFYTGGGNSHPNLDTEIHALDFLTGRERRDLLSFLNSLTGEMPEWSGAQAKCNRSSLNLPALKSGVLRSRG